MCRRRQPEGINSPPVTQLGTANGALVSKSADRITSGARPLMGNPGGRMSWIPALFGMPIGGVASFHNRHSGQFIHLKRDVLTAPTGGYQFTAGDTIRDGKRSASEQVGRQNYVRCETADGQPKRKRRWGRGEHRRSVCSWRIV